MSERFRDGVVVVIGKGAREDALVKQYAKSPHVKEIVAIPGNDFMQVGVDKEVDTWYRDINVTDVTGIRQVCEHIKPSLVDVPQDNAIRAGIADITRRLGIPTVGPSRLAGEIEWNKAYSRRLSEQMGIPIPKYSVCTSVDEGIAYLDTQPDQPWAVKAALLAEGKGVLLTKDRKEAKAKIKELKRRFPEAARIYLLEELLRNDDGTAGEEFSAFVLSDGKNWQFLGAAQDYKRVENFDKGENTGSMGSSSPALVYDSSIRKTVEETIIEPTLSGLSQEGEPYQGILYISGMKLQKDGQTIVKLIEHNSRWGDPEAQVIVPGISDFYELNMAAATGKLDEIVIRTDGHARVAVIGASRGYPGDYKGAMDKQIHGLDEIREREGVLVYGAGIRKTNGKWYGTGGRILTVVGEGIDVIDAREKAYGALNRISVDGNNLQYRHDIAWRDVARKRQTI